MESARDIIHWSDEFEFYDDDRPFNLRATTRQRFAAKPRSADEKQPLYEPTSVIKSFRPETNSIDSFLLALRHSPFAADREMLESYRTDPPETGITTPRSKAIIKARGIRTDSYELFQHRFYHCYWYSLLASLDDSPYVLGRISIFPVPAPQIGRFFQACTKVNARRAYWDTPIRPRLFFYVMQPKESASIRSTGLIAPSVRVTHSDQYQPAIPLYSSLLLARSHCKRDRDILACAVVSHESVGFIEEPDSFYALPRTAILPMFRICAPDREALAKTKPSHSQTLAPPLDCTPPVPKKLQSSSPPPAQVEQRGPGPAQISTTLVQRAQEKLKRNRERRKKARDRTVERMADSTASVVWDSL